MKESFFAYVGTDISEHDLGMQESYSNLFYGRTASGGYAFSNDEGILTRFCPQAFPVEPNTYFADGAFTTYREPAVDGRRIVQKGQVANAVARCR